SYPRSPTRLPCTTLFRSGFAGGYAAAKFLDPLQPERLDHLVAALACLALTAIAIMFSIVNAIAVSARHASAATRWSRRSGCSGSDRKSTRLNSSHVAISY